MAYLQLEGGNLSWGSRLRGHVGDERLAWYMLVWCSNHLLNLCCGLADLGCISAVLWGFEDRELVLDSLEATYGARLHVASDLLSLAVQPAAMGSETLELIVGRLA